MKTIGILGGLGPQATMDFEQRIHQVAQRRIPQQGNSGYPPMVVYYLRNPPVLNDATGRPLMPIQPDPRLLAAARALGQLSDFLVITSNGVHAMQPLIEQAAERPVLSMIEVTLAEIERRGWHRLGVLAYFTPQVYAQALEAHGKAWISIGAELQHQLNQAIQAVMEGRNTPQMTEVARQAVLTLRERGVDGVILGCTELPLLLEADLAQPDLLNPTAILAEAAVRQALGE